MPYRKEALDEMRAGIEADLKRIETTIDRGATFFVTPEGEYPTDGKMLPFRGIWARLEPHARRVFLCAISYDPFRGRKFSQLYRVVPLEVRQNAREELQAARPVTVSALVAHWLLGGMPDFTEQELIAGVQSQPRALPRCLFVDPELRADPAGCVLQAIEGLCRLGIVRAHDGGFAVNSVRRHPRFEHTDDILEQQASFFAETLEGAMKAQAVGPLDRVSFARPGV